jgi:hypothetical protein
VPKYMGMRSDRSDRQDAYATLVSPHFCNSCNS